MRLVECFSSVLIFKSVVALLISRQIDFVCVRTGYSIHLHLPDCNLFHLVLSPQRRTPRPSFSFFCVSPRGSPRAGTFQVSSWNMPTSTQLDSTPASVEARIEQIFGTCLTASSQRWQRLFLLLQAMLSNTNTLRRQRKPFMMASATFDTKSLIFLLRYLWNTKW